MREILFRGKRIDNGEWVYGYYVYTKDSKGKHQHFIVTPEWFIVDPETVGQYTDLTDKNGKKIFDGDIVRQTIVLRYQPIGQICYNAENCQWRIEYVNNIVSFSSVGSGRSYELLGNIHDNPELLEVKE